MLSPGSVSIFLLFGALFLVDGAAVTGGKGRGARLGSGPSDTPISTNPPNLPGGSVAVDAPPGPFFQDFQPPFPTDSWWSGMTVGTQDAQLAGPFPFQSATRDTGLVFGISMNREFDGKSLKHPTSYDWSLTFTEHPKDLTHRKALSWDTQVVCLSYFNDGSSSTMDTCMVPGSPYFTATYKNAQVRIESLQGDVTDFTWVSQGTKAKVTNNGGTYLIYVVGAGAITLTQEENTLVSNPGFSGTLRFAKLTEASQEAILDQHYNTFATGLDMTYTVAGDVSTQTWAWEVEGNANDLLLLSWPHHRKVLENPNYVNIQYLTLKGYMKGVRGNTWTLKHNLPAISWFPANDPHPSCVPELTKTLEAEVNALTVMVPGDFYFWGGAFGRAAQLATIAEHVGRTDLINKVVDILKESIGYWFDPAHRPQAAYEPGWGGFINGDGWNNTWVDFGNAYYNDHHFHYGYILHGAAVIGKYDQAWLNEHLDFLMQCARGVGNPSPNDPHYTVTRHMDWFAGHSWASGIANGAGPRDQESSGEAINGYYGLLLFAHAINNQALIDYSRMLVAVEIHGAQVYWQLHPVTQDPDTPYPEQEFRDLSTVGNVMDWQTGAWLFWGEQRTQISAIQILPLTPIGQYTYDNDWMESVLPYCKIELDDPAIGDAFKSVIYAAYAKVNPQEAYTYSEGLFDWGTGNSATNQLYFVSTQSSAADICSAGSQTPEGTYYIQEAGSNLFVSAGGNGELAAETVASVLATKFELRFTPGGSTIQALSNGKYVSGSPDGLNPLAANRDSPSSYEVFRWTVQPDGTYELTAMVNRVPVSTGPNGELFNNPASAGVKFRLIAAEDAEPVPVPAQGVLRSLDNNQFVSATAADTTLRSNSATAAGATTWSFEPVQDSTADPPYFTIKSETTNMYVTADQGGAIPLAATRAEPQAWEHFQIIGYEGNYLILHVASGNLVALQPDGTLIDNSNSPVGVSLWSIE